MRLLHDLIETKFVYEVQISSTKDMQEVEDFVSAIKHLNSNIDINVIRKGIMSASVEKGGVNNERTV